MGLFSPVAFLGMPTRNVVMYSTSKKRVLLATLSSEACLQVAHSGEIVSDRKDQAKLWYVICTFQIWCFPSSQDGFLDCCAETLFFDLEGEAVVPEIDRQHFLN
jgi:hypothetical protein